MFSKFLWGRWEILKYFAILVISNMLMFYQFLCCPYTIKVVVSPSRKFVFIRFNKSSLKMMENTFCFMLKALYLHFCRYFLLM